MPPPPQFGAILLDLTSCEAQEAVPVEAVPEAAAFGEGEVKLALAGGAEKKVPLKRAHP